MFVVAFISFAIIVCLARGPREQRWFGWTGGWAIRKDDLPPQKGETVTEKALEEATSLKDVNQKETGSQNASK